MASLSRFFQSSLDFQRLFKSSRLLAMMVRSSSSVVASSGDSKVLPYSAIPGPKGTIRNCLDYALSKGSYFECIAKRFERFGPIYSEQLLDTRFVNLCDVDAIAKVLRTESTFQMRPGFAEAVAEIIEDDNGLALASNDYETWHSVRSLMTPKLSRPKEISSLFPIINTVADDFVERLHFITQSDVQMNNIDRELNVCVVEAFASMLFSRRLGLYNHPPDPTAVAFVNASLNMIRNIGKLFLSAPLHKYIKTPAYYRLKKSLARIHDIGMNIIDDVLATKKERKNKDSDNKQSVFEYLVANGRDSPKAMAAITGLVAAGIDTTSATALWLLYLLAQHQDTQEKLYQELLSAIGPGGEVTASNVPSFLKAAMKESQRMYPVAGYIVARVFDKDLDVLGYHIPSGVNIIMHEHLGSLDERYHGSDAKEFVPERWLRDETGRMKEVKNSFTSLPFGYGVRSCLGRRMAEAMMYTLVSKIVLSYRLESGTESRVNPGLRAALMKPNRPVSLKFIPRE